MTPSQEYLLRIEAKKRGYSPQETEELISFTRQKKGLAPKQESSSFGERLKQSASAGINKIKSASRDIDSGNPLRFVEGAVKAGAGAVETVLSPATAALEPVVEPTIGRAVKYTSDKISDIPAVQRFANSKAGDITSRAIEGVNNLNTIAGAVIGPKVAGRAGSAVSNTTRRIGTNISENLPQAPALNGIKNIAGMVADEARRLPDRIKTNVAERQVVQDTIRKLPSETAKRAAQDGIEVADIKTLLSIPKVQIPVVKRLAEVVRKFSNGETKVNPIEIVGKPIVNRLKELEVQRGKIGSKLGAEAKKLGVVTSEELVPAVLNKLKSVPGLQNLKLTQKGVLDFRDTVLTTAETLSDRKAIQSIFRDATRWGQGTKKHLLRQELFEAIGGKKRSLDKLTATQEKAYQAVREGLSDVLGSKNPSYKTLSAKYKQVIDPLEQIKKVMRVAGESEDIMNMSAGLLARRLTSAAQSNPQIRAILSAMDKATSRNGKARLSVETLQDVYNILEKYYDIAPKTGFQAQVTQGVEKAASGALDYVAEQLKGYAGQTPAVRQKALESLLEEILGKSK